MEPIGYSGTPYNPMSGMSSIGGMGGGPLGYGMPSMYGSMAGFGGQMTPAAIPTGAQTGGLGTSTPTTPGAGGGMFGSIGGLDGLRAITGGLGSLGSLYMGLKGLGLMKDQFNFQKQSYDTNMANQTQAYNTNLDGQIHARYAAENLAPAAADQYIAAHKL